MSVAGIQLRPLPPSRKVQAYKTIPPTVISSTSFHFLYVSVVKLRNSVTLFENRSKFKKLLKKLISVAQQMDK
jgi:hypothetical protein